MLAYSGSSLVGVPVLVFARWPSLARLNRSRFPLNSPGRAQEHLQDVDTKHADAGEDED